MTDADEPPEGWIAHDGGELPPLGRVSAIWVAGRSAPSEGRLECGLWWHEEGAARLDIIAYRPEQAHGN